MMLQTGILRLEPTYLVLDNRPWYRAVCLVWSSWKKRSEEVDEAVNNFEEKHMVFQYRPGIVRTTNGDTLAVAAFKNSRDYVGCAV